MPDTATLSTKLQISIPEAVRTAAEQKANGFDTKIALAAAAICSEHKLATADAIVYAAALEHGADLLTCDAHFEGLPGVMFIAKINA